MSSHHFYCHRSCWVKAVKQSSIADPDPDQGGAPPPWSLRGPGAGPGQFFSYPHLWVLTTIMAPTQPFVPLSQETVIRKLNKDMEKPKIYGEVLTKRSHTEWKVQSATRPWSGLGSSVSR